MIEYVDKLKYDGEIDYSIYKTKYILTEEMHYEEILIAVYSLK
jgi:hypothetical protein